MYIAIAGNIGSGKTTLTEMLTERYGAKAYYCLLYTSTAGLITCICFPECPSMKKQFGQWNVIRIAGGPDFNGKGTGD